MQKKSNSNTSLFVGALFKIAFQLFKDGSKICISGTFKAEGKESIFPDAKGIGCDIAFEVNYVLGKGFGTFLAYRTPIINTNSKLWYT